MCGAKTAKVWQTHSPTRHSHTSGHTLSKAHHAVKLDILLYSYVAVCGLWWSFEELQFLSLEARRLAN